MLVKRFASHRKERESNFLKCDFLYSIVAFTIVSMDKHGADDNWGRACRNFGLC